MCFRLFTGITNGSLTDKVILISQAFLSHSDHRKPLFISFAIMFPPYVTPPEQLVRPEETVQETGVVQVGEV